MVKVTCTLALALAASTTDAFAPPSNPLVRTEHCSPRLFMSETETPESAFVADVPEGAEAMEEDKTFEAVEKMGRGAAKVRTNEVEKEKALWEGSDPFLRARRARLTHLTTHQPNGQKPK